MATIAKTEVTVAINKAAKNPTPFSLKAIPTNAKMIALIMAVIINELLMLFKKLPFSDPPLYFKNCPMADNTPIMIATNTCT